MDNAGFGPEMGGAQGESLGGAPSEMPEGVSGGMPGSVMDGGSAGMPGVGSGGGMGEVPGSVPGGGPAMTPVMGGGMNRPMLKAPIVLPVQKPSHKKLIIGSIIGVAAVAILGAVVAVLMLGMNRSDPVAKAMNKLMSGGMPTNLVAKTDINAQIDGDKQILSHFNVSANTSMMPATLTNETDLTVTMGGRNMNDVTFQASEIYAGEEELYLMIDGLDVAIDRYLDAEEYTNTETIGNGETTENELGECIDESGEEVDCATITEIEEEDDGGEKIENSQDEESGAQGKKTEGQEGNAGTQSGGSETQGGGKETQGNGGETQEGKNNAQNAGDEGKGGEAKTEGEKTENQSGDAASKHVLNCEPGENASEVNCEIAVDENLTGDGKDKDTGDADTVSTSGKQLSEMEIYLGVARGINGKWLKTDPNVIFAKTNPMKSTSKSGSGSETDSSKTQETVTVADFVEKMRGLLRSLGGGNWTCDVDLISKLRSNSRTVAEIYRNNPFVGGTREEAAIRSKSYPVYRVFIDQETYATFIEEIREKGLLEAYTKCAGKSYADITNFPSEMPPIYVEVDSDANFTRFYTSTTVGDMSVIVNLDFSYPAEVSIKEPQNYTTLEDGLQKALDSTFSPTASKTK